MSKNFNVRIVIKDKAMSNFLRLAAKVSKKSPLKFATDAIIKEALTLQERLLAEDRAAEVANEPAE